MRAPLEKLFPVKKTNELYLNNADSATVHII